MPSSHNRRLLSTSLSVAAVAITSLSSSVTQLDAFSPAPTSSRRLQHGGISRIGGAVPSGESSTALYNRQARRKNKKKKKKRSSLVLDDDGAPSSNAGGSEPTLTGGGEIGYSADVDSPNVPVADSKSPGPEDGVLGETVTSPASVSDMPPQAGEAQPDVTTIITDPDTGIARIQQGKYVMDKVTGKAVILSSLGPEFRLAQMFPGVPDEVRERHRFDWTTVTVPEMVDRLREACTVPLRNGATGEEFLGIPPHPQVSNPSVDFVLANRDLLGHRMQKTLGRLKLRAQSQFKKDEALELRALWKHFMLLEDHISAPFRQCMLDAEGRIGPNFGNLDMKSYCAGDLYERTANYLILKSMVAHWEKKYNDAIQLDTLPDNDGMNFYAELYTGDPKRYLPDPPIIFRLNEVSRIVVMAQKMCAAFVNETELFDDLPPEVKFVEKALSIQGGTALRQFMLEDFCPNENVDPASLREALGRLYQQMFNMQTDPYGDLTMTLWNLCESTRRGTDDGREPYEEYIANFSGRNYENNPGYFQTYTFDHDKNSLVRFLDSAKVIEKGTAGSAEDVAKQVKGEAFQLLGFDIGGGGSPNPNAPRDDTKEQKAYVVPEDRAVGRPHMLGWLDILGEDEEGGNLKEESFESDKWEEVKA